MEKNGKKGKNRMARFGVSIETELLDPFDALIQRRGYRSRSEAFRDLMREQLVRDEWADENKTAVGILGLVFSHDTRELTEKLNQIQHNFFRNIVSTTHIHLDHHNCLEVIVMKGKSADITRIADMLISTRSVKDGKLLKTTTGAEIG
ncbi:MAG: nickel-responsive transcriptional regulator NikR [Candidatus Aminicenantes bacterium]|nr:nickel-responsive transcriptional regulator NikR [Candidatus Aminicenantes bacterium]